MVLAILIHLAGAQIIRYLLCEYLYIDQVMLPSLAELEAVTGNYKADEVDVEGMSLAKAIGKCCDEVGIRFKFVPRQSENGPSSSVVFYRPGVGRRVELNCQWPGDKLSVSRTNVLRVESEKSFWPVTHRYIGFGDVKVYEATFDLVKAWDPSLEGGQRADYSPSTNSEFESVREVYRMWCLNEAGDYSSAPYNQGDVFNFSQIFETDDYIPRKRKFLKTISTDIAGDSFGYYAEVSYDSGSTWLEFTDSFDVFNDECAIWLSDDAFSDSVWNAAVAGTLKFRITASVESDQRLSCEVAKGPINSVEEVTDHIIDKASLYKFRKVTGKSIFANGPADEADDTEALMGYVRRIAKSSLEIIETIEVETLMAAAHYEVGDRLVSSPDSRDILGVRFDDRSVF